MTHEEALVDGGQVTFPINYDVRRVSKCDGVSDHYYWHLRGKDDPDAQCFDSLLDCIDDAKTTIAGWVSDATYGQFHNLNIEGRTK